MKKCYQFSVVDGDTIACNDGYVRLLGIDAPESSNNERCSYQSTKYSVSADLVVWCGNLSKDYLTNLLSTCTSLTVDYDESNADTGYRDAYGRELGYVFCDEWFVNQKLLLDGYADLLTDYPLDNQRDIILKSAFDNGFQNDRGIWPYLKGVPVPEHNSGSGNRPSMGGCSMINNRPTSEPDYIIIGLLVFALVRVVRMKRK